jgi:hypothetical protein
MFSLQQRGNSRVAEAHTDFHPKHATGPLDGELADLYVAILIVVPLALLLKSFFF